MNRLGGQAQVGHDGNPRGNNAARHFRHLPPPFELHRLGARLLEEAAGVADGLVHRDLVGHEGHVADHEGAAHGPGDGLRMMDHDVHRHGERAFVSQDHHRQGVAHEDQVDARLVHHGCGGVVVGGDHGDLLASLFHVADGCRGDLVQLAVGAHEVPPDKMELSCSACSRERVPFSRASFTVCFPRTR